MTRSHFLVAGLIAATCSFVPLTTSAQNTDCSKAASSAEQDECGERLLAIAEADLKDAFADALQHYNPAADEKKENAALPKYDTDREAQYEKRVRRNLEVSQKIWLQYRATACSAVFESYEGGTIGPLARSLCKEETTRQRIKFLRDYFPESK